MYSATVVPAKNDILIIIFFRLFRNKYTDNKQNPAQRQTYDSQLHGTSRHPIYSRRRSDRFADESFVWYT